jgi:hypothetical protein
MTHAERVYNVAVKHLQTVQVAVDRLVELKATAELKLLTGRLQRLAFRTTPLEPGDQP